LPATSVSELLHLSQPCQQVGPSACMLFDAGRTSYLGAHSARDTARSWSREDVLTQRGAAASFPHPLASAHGGHAGCGQDASSTRHHPHHTEGSGGGSRCLQRASPFPASTWRQQHWLSEGLGGAGAGEGGGADMTRLPTSSLEGRKLLNRSTPAWRQAE
jgi:hypothetical protein